MKKKSLTALLGFLAFFAAQAAEYHVSPGGLDTNDGSTSQPFKTISAAAAIAQPGDVITVHEGVYRERVNPPRGGTSDGTRIVYRAAEGAKVIIKGSEIIKGWEKVRGHTWKVTLSNSFFGDFNPYNDVIQGEWHRPGKGGYPRTTGMVYVNGVWMDEAETLQKVLPTPSPATLMEDKVLEASSGPAVWKAKVDEKNTTLWANFKGIDPNKELIEINVRQSIFYPEKPGLNYITVSGFTMQHAATPWAGAMSEQIGLIGTHWSKGWIIENNVISHSMNTGITLGRYDLGRFGLAMPVADAEGYIKSIELAGEHGWSKEKVGGHIVRNNHISHCEKNGIHGSLGAIFSTIEGNSVSDIAVRGWSGGHDIAGIKILAPIDTLIRDNHIYRCRGWGGMWLDWMTQGTRVTGNLLHDNTQDLFTEVNHGPFLIDNNLFLSTEGKGVVESSGGGAYCHNLFGGNFGIRRERGRTTPFHRAHSTEILGSSRVSNHDDRYYNNVFAGSKGLSVYGEIARWVSDLKAVGNVYLAGTRPGPNDQDELLVAGFKPELELIKRSDGWWLKMAIDPTWEAMKKRPLVTTELLGKAKVPDAPFVNPDGTPYRLDTDYFGKKRNPENPAAGPFASQGEQEIYLRIWPKK